MTDITALMTGIGPEAAALCSSYIVECASNIKDFIYAGTSGWSAQVSHLALAVRYQKIKCIPVPNELGPHPTGPLA